VPPSRRAELWLQAFKGRLGSVGADHVDHVDCVDAARDARGLFLAAELPRDAVARSRAATVSLLEERTEKVEAMLSKIGKIEETTRKLGEARTKARDAAKERNESLAKAMTETETARMTKEAELLDVEDQCSSAVRAADRVDQRLRNKLDASRARSAARLADAKLLSRKQQEASQTLIDEAAASFEAVRDAKLDALRVRCVTLGHEKANLAEHMELLEEHLERLKADLDQKHSEVAEVEHQWAQTKAKLPNLKAKHADAERRRTQVADLARRLKLKCKDSKGSLPRQLLQHLDPMERQALDDL